MADVSSAEATGWRRWLRYAFVVVALIFIVGSFLPLWQTDEWWVREWDYPRLQIAGLLLLSGTLLLSLNWRWSRGEIASSRSVLRFTEKGPPRVQLAAVRPLHT